MYVAQVDNTDGFNVYYFNSMEELRDVVITYLMHFPGKCVVRKTKSYTGPSTDIGHLLTRWNSDGAFIEDTVEE